VSDRQRLPLHSVPATAPELLDGSSVTAELAAAQAEAEQLRDAMASRAKIEQAKGMLMLAYGFDEDRAFRTLVRWSSMHNIKLRVVAATMVDLARRDNALGLNIHLVESMVTDSLRALTESDGAYRAET
jgi:hypothetical protein